MATLNLNNAVRVREKDCVYMCDYERKVFNIGSVSLILQKEAVQETDGASERPSDQSRPPTDGQLPFLWVHA